MDEKLFDEDFMRKLDNVSLHFQSTVNHVYSGGRRSRAHGSTVEFSDYREYALGDDFRRIDWNAYARAAGPGIFRYIPLHELGNAE